MLWLAILVLGSRDADAMPYVSVHEHWAAISFIGFRTLHYLLIVHQSQS